MKTVLKNNWLTQQYMKNMPILYVVDAQGVISHYPCPKSMLNEIIPTVYQFNSEKDQYEAYLIPCLTPASPKYWSVNETKVKDISAIIKSKTAAVNKAIELGAIVDQNKIDYAAKAAECSEIEEQLQKALTELQNKDTENNRLGGLIDKQNQKLADLRNEVDLIVKNKMELLEQCKSYEAHVAELTNIIDGDNQELTRVKNEIDSLNEHIDLLQQTNTHNANKYVEDIAKSELTIKQLNDQINELTNKNTSLDTTITKLTNDNKTLTADNKKLTASNNRIIDINQNLAKELTEIKEEIGKIIQK